MTLNLVRCVVILIWLASLGHAAPKEIFLVVPANELSGVLPFHVSSGDGVDVHLRDGNVLRWKTAAVSGLGLVHPGHKTDSVLIDNVAFLHIRHRSNSKVRRWLGGIAGFLIGSVTGGVLAIGVSESYGKDGLSTVFLTAFPIAGAWLGQRLAKPNFSYTTLAILPPIAGAE